MSLSLKNVSKQYKNQKAVKSFKHIQKNPKLFSKATKTKKSSNTQTKGKICQALFAYLQKK